MSKITTANIVPVVIQYAAKYVCQRFNSNDAAAISAASSAKKWKRASKYKLKKYLFDMSLHLSELEGFGWEYENILDTQPLTEDCICRHFINDVLDDGLDPMVVTDPEDTKILRIYWHCD